MEIVKSLTNGELHKFREVVIMSGNGYTAKMDIMRINLIELYDTGLVYLEETNGNIRYYNKADVFFKQAE